MKKYQKLNTQLIPLGDGDNPTPHVINPHYKQQPGNSRKCTECGRMHDTIVENTMTGERIEEIEKCKECFMVGAFTFFK